MDTHFFFNFTAFRFQCQSRFANCVTRWDLVSSSDHLELELRLCLHQQTASSQWDRSNFAVGNRFFAATATVCRVDFLYSFTYATTVCTVYILLFIRRQTVRDSGEYEIYAKFINMMYSMFAIFFSLGALLPYVTFGAQNMCIRALVDQRSQNMHACIYASPWMLEMGRKSENRKKINLQYSWKNHQLMKRRREN